MIVLNEQEANRFEVGYRPNNCTIKENPARFTFMPHDDESHYIIQVSLTKDFSNIKYEFKDIDLCFYTPDIIFENGTYFWRYACYQNDKIVSNYSKVRCFSVDETSVLCPLVSREKRYDFAHNTYPRLLLNKEGIKEVRNKIKENPNYCDFDLFYNNSVTPWINKKTPTMIEDMNYDWSEFEQDYLTPEPPLNLTKIRKRWRATYITCQEVFYKINFLSLSGRLLENDDLIKEAKELLLHVAKWNRFGSTFHDVNDEACYRVTRSLTWGYDMLHDHLDVEEEKLVREMIYDRLKHTFNHLRYAAKIHLTPYNSHPVRSINMVVVPACLVLLHHYPEVKDWLNYSIEYMSAIYTPWGGPDGGWAEGGLYWTTAMNAAFEGMNFLMHYLKVNLYERLFFQKTGDFILSCYTADTIRSSFCDQSTLGRKVSLKTGFLLRQLAYVTKKKEYQFYYNSFLPWNTTEFKQFFNYGWWDFYYENFMHLHTFKDIEAKEPQDMDLKVFNDVGWAAMHSNYGESEKHIQLLFKSSPFGSISHSHADQNGFLIHAYGEPLAIENGYYFDYGGKMHFDWCKQTISENCLLINQKGQYTFEVDLVYETKSTKKTDMVKQIESNGKIIEYGKKDNYTYVIGDATKAYLPNVPTLNHSIREIYFVDNSYFVIKDKVSLKEEADISFLFHTMYEMQISQESFIVSGKKASMDVNFVYASSEVRNISQTDLFGDLEEIDYGYRERQWHLKMTTNKSKEHILITLLVPYRNEEKIEVSSKNNGNSIEFDNNGKKFNITTS